MTLANKITALRILTVPAFFIVLINRSYTSALLIGLFAGATDALDGLIARRLRQRTPLGSFLDPLADKLLLLAAYGGLVLNGDLPVWVLALTLGRDLLVALGWGLLALRKGAWEARTRYSGKVATASQMVFVAVAILSQALGPPGPARELVVWGLLCVMAALTLYSTLDYLRYGRRRLAKLPRQ